MPPDPLPLLLALSKPFPDGPVLDPPCPRVRISSDRLDALATAATLTSRTHPRPHHDPLGTLVEDKGAVARRALCSSYTPRFFPARLAPGVLSDGTWTTKHPSVSVFLESPTARPALSSRTSAAIYSLAALHVFYSPSHPSYDVFWHPDIKESTAAFVHEVVTMKPSPISTTPMTWLGVHDMLWQLTGIQKEYARAHGIKASTSPPVPTRRSLRKRKPVQAVLQEASTREPSEVPEPPRKKLRRTKSDGDDKEGDISMLAVGVSDMSPEQRAGPSAQQPAKPKSTTPSPQETRGNLDPTPSPLTITSPLPSDSQLPPKEDAAQVGTSRGRTKDAASKKASGNKPASRTSSRRARERSPSFSSGSSTAVSAAGGNTKRGRSSSSASSTVTTVDAVTGKGKGKEKAIDVAEVVDEETEDDEATKRSAKPRRSTAREARSKSSKRSGAQATPSPAPEMQEKAATAVDAAPRPTRNRSRATAARSRKARKS
ncbi:hypothetical protein BC834DRAFT_968218 [Gloeopeniophorella convolvens]|nr:hypothetical protein BC834DRAFT_968218 [Gloeopeniophorella convolvens]